jgi:AcrR family transcriptional regulator
VSCDVVTDRGDRFMHIPTPEERRGRHLEAGSDLLAHPDPATCEPTLALSHVRLADVAASEGVRKGAVYHYWHSHREFWRDLLVLLESEGRLSDAIRAATTRCGAIGSRPTPHDIWALGDDMFETINRDGVLPVALATLAFQPDDVSRPSLQSAADMAVSRIEEFLDRSLPNVGLTLRPDRDRTRLATSLLSLLVGLSIQHRLDPSSVRKVALLPTREVTLYAASASALILESCEVTGITEAQLDDLRWVYEAG